MLYVFSGCLAFGIFYSIVSLIFGGHHGGGHDVGGAGHEIAGSSANIHAGAHGGHAADSADSPSPFNPLVIASAITTFGAIGLIGKLGFRMGDILSTIFALTFAGTVGAIIFFGVVKLMYSSQSNSTFSLYDLLETEAEVITPIPENGAGEIAYIINGIRSSLAAKSMSNEKIERGDKIIIKDFSGSTAIVTRKITIEELDLFSPQDSEVSDDQTGNGRVDRQNKI